MTSERLRHALSDEPTIRPLPGEVVRLLTTLDAPPRLAAHLRAVHDVAVQLVDWVQVRFPTVPVDREVVRLGAALHDLGKAVHPAELCGPGSAHEAEGYRLLRSQGVAEEVARIARDHAEWQRADATMELLLVALADKVWKDKRVVDLEEIVVDRLAAATGEQRWAIFADLDEDLTAIGSHAVDRLAFQNRHPVSTTTADLASLGELLDRTDLELIEREEAADHAAPMDRS